LRAPPLRLPSPETLRQRLNEKRQAMSLEQRDLERGQELSELKRDYRKLKRENEQSGFKIGIAVGITLIASVFGDPEGRPIVGILIVLFFGWFFVKNKLEDVQRRNFPTETE
jgi:hypothetical protein